MNILVKANDNYLENLLEANKYGFDVITVFELILNGKENIKKQLLEIHNKKKDLKPKIMGIIVVAQDIENSSVGTVNALRQDFDLVIGMGGLNKSNRFFVEDTKIDFLLDPQNARYRSKMDFIHHFNSGLNQVLCTMAKEKNIGLIFSLNFTQSYNKTISKEIGRINQNIKFAIKYKLPIHINYIIENKFQIKSQKQLDTTFSLFNASAIQMNENKNILKNRLLYNKEIKSESYIADGIKIIK
jgi:RNase P/RNase MRP subunit p30